MHLAAAGYARPARTEPATGCKLHYLRLAGSGRASSIITSPHAPPYCTTCKLAQLPNEALAAARPVSRRTACRCSHHWRPLWTHNDRHASNLFWSDAGANARPVAVIDFGLADRTNAVHDLAHAIERNIVDGLC